MPAVTNSLRIETPSPGVVAAQPMRLAVGIRLAELQQLVGLAGDEHAPHFLSSQEPTEDGKAYQATNGHRYYRPLLRVAQRSGGSSAPDVRFLRDAQGKVRLQIGLEEAPVTGLSPGAEPFNVRVDQARLEWDEVESGQPKRKQRIFQQPTLVGEGRSQDSAKPHFSIRVAAELTSEEVMPLAAALSKPERHATLIVTLSFGFWVDQQPRSAGGIPPTVPPSGGMDPIYTIADAARRRAVLERADERRRQPNFQNVSLTRTIPFTFEETSAQSRPIFAALRDGSGLGSAWVLGNFGWVREAPFPNTWYRLPDEIRLDYDSDLGIPYFIPFLYRPGGDEAAEPRVRVVLRARAWHDPKMLSGLRNELYQLSGGALAAPSIITGGYEDAKLNLKGAFPEWIQIQNGEAMSVSLERGFEIRLDLSAEFYRLLCTQMVRATGLTGVVTVTLDSRTPTSTGSPAAATGSTAAPSVGATTSSETGPSTNRVDRPVNVVLTLRKLATLPVAVALDGDAISPTKVYITNKARTRIRVNECLPLLLKCDENSVVPLDAFDGQSTKPLFPLSLPPDVKVAVQIKPKEDHTRRVWNAIQLELSGEELLQRPEEVLERIHEVAPNASTARKITVSCPVFLKDPLPARFQNLYEVQVQIANKGAVLTSIELNKTKPQVQIALQQSLRDIVGADTIGISTLSYKARNIYFDHEGVWGPARTEQTSNLIVFPNSPEND